MSKLIQRALARIDDLSRVRLLLSDSEKKDIALVGDLTRELEHCYRLLESLTPSGSEFYHNPERCAEYVRNTLREQHELILKQQKELRELRKKS